MRKILITILALLIAAPVFAQVAPLLSVDKSSSISVPNQFQVIQNQNTGRHGCFIQNPNSATETLFVYFGPVANATTANSASLSAGASVSCQNVAYGVLADQLSVSAATAGHAYVAYLQ